jgi:DNA-binding ferritin-like protein
MATIPRPSIFASSPMSMNMSRSSGSETCGLCIQTAALAQDMLNAVTSLHRIHWKVTGLGSYAAHKALNEGYDAFGDHADDLVEEYQGAEEKLLDLPNTAPSELNSVEEALDYLRKMKDKIEALQSVMPHSEINNLLDEAKSTINSVKYKLLFLK